jgi:hypothetical protein
MAVKLLMTWDIKSGREAEFFEFQVREWVPGLQKLGLEPTDAWYTMYGASPQIMIGGTAKTLKTMNQILETEGGQGLGRFSTLARSGTMTKKARLDEAGFLFGGLCAP